MGSTLSPPADCEALAAQFFQEIPANYADVGIEESLLMFSGIDSLTRLKELSSNLQGQLLENLPDFVEKIGEVLKDLTPVPNAVGLGAFVLSTVLRIAFHCVMDSSGSNEPSPMEMLQRVFAEEKSSEVWNLIEEYLKRYKMYLYDDHCLLQETERLEKQLSLQLTRLRNSILVDQQMSSRAVKHWVNGAAFHAQMLIHITRLKKRTGEETQAFENAKRAASSAVDTYHNDLNKILEKYKEYKISKLEVWRQHYPYSPYFLEAPQQAVVLPPPPPPPICNFREREIDFCCTLLNHIRLLPCDYVDYIFLNHKELKEIKVYFFNLQKNIDVLVNQIGDFKIES